MLNPIAITTTAFSSRQFNQDTARAKRACRCGPVFITDRGKTTHVLLNIQNYQGLMGTKSAAAAALNMADMLAMPGGEDIGFDPPRMGKLSRPVDLL